MVKLGISQMAWRADSFAPVDVFGFDFEVSEIKGGSENQSGFWTNAFETGLAS